MIEVVRSFELGTETQLTMDEIADKHHVTVKTLERRFKKNFGITPKLFADILKLQRTAKTISQSGKQKLNHGDLSEALGLGYYDQSHFVKVCRKITGLSPKQLFLQMPNQITDFIVESV